MRTQFQTIFILSFFTAFLACTTDDKKNSDSLKLSEEDSTVEMSTNISIDLSYETKDTIIFPGSNGDCEGTSFRDFQTESETNSQFDTLDFNSLTSSVAHLKNNGTYLSIYLLNDKQKEEFISSNYESPILKTGEFGIKLNLFNKAILPLGTYNSSNEFAERTAKFWIISEKDGNQVSSSLIAEDIEVNLISLTETKACGSFHSSSSATKFSGSFNAVLDYIAPIE